MVSEPGTDRQLVNRVLHGDPQAFAVLVERYERPVYALCCRMLGDADEAEDAAQEAFLRAYQHLARYDAGRSFQTWLLAIASHHCVDRLRRRRPGWLSIEDLLPSHPALAGKGPGPEEVAVAGERDAAVWSMLAQLPPRYRLVVILHYWHDMTCAEIAQVCRISEGAVKSRLFRARRMLADQLEAWRLPQRVAIAGGV